MIFARHLAHIIGVLLLSGCAGGASPPAWQANAQLGMRNFEQAYLTGNARVAEAEFVRARSEIAATGQADLVARAELVRCAVRTASLEFDDCPAFVALYPDAAAQSRAYAAYIAGRWEGLDANLLPAQHRAVIAGGPLSALEDPLARLVAAGASLRAGKLAPQAIPAAVEAASLNGWRRPLLAWLGVQAKRAEAAGDAEALEQVRRRMDLVSGTPGR